MKPKYNSAAEPGPAPVRTGEAIPETGIWQTNCAREGCKFIEDLVLAEGAPAPPCRHCCNPSQLIYLGAAPIVADEIRIGVVKGPQRPPESPTPQEAAPTSAPTPQEAAPTSPPA